MMAVFFGVGYSQGRSDTEVLVEGNYRYICKVFTGQNEIILFDPKKAAKLINSNLNNINDWWLDKKRQAGIKYFCSNMCRYENSLKNSINIISKKLVNKN